MSDEGSKTLRIDVVVVAEPYREAIGENHPKYSSDAYVEAIRILTSSGSAIWDVGHQTACHPGSHPDADIVRNWLNAKSLDVLDFDVLFALATFIRNEWGYSRHMTRSQHRMLYGRIRCLCTKLNEALEETGAPYIRGGGTGLSRADVRQLMTHYEEADFTNSIKPLKYILGDTNEFSWECEPTLPSVAAVLRRISIAAERLEQQGPLHSQPANAGPSVAISYVA